MSRNSPVLVTRHSSLPTVSSPPCSPWLRALRVNSLSRFGLYSPLAIGAPLRRGDPDPSGLTTRHCFFPCVILSPSISSLFILLRTPSQFILPSAFLFNNLHTHCKTGEGVPPAVQGSTLEVRGSINPAVGKMQVRSNLQLLTSFRCYRPGTSLTNQTRSIPDTMSEWPARSAEGQNSAVLIPREPSPPARPLATLRSVVLTRNPKLSTFLTPLRAFQSLPAFLWREKLPVGSLRAHPASGIPAGKGLEWTESPRTEESCPTPTRSVLPEQDLERSENNQLDHTPGFNGGISL